MSLARRHLNQSSLRERSTMSNPPANLSPSVLIVDENYSDYQCLLEPAKSLEVALNFANSGRAALRIIQQQPLDLAIVSLCLSDMSGFDVIEMIHSLRSETTLYAVDQSANEQHEIRALCLNCEQYLCKPASASWLNSYNLFCNGPRAGPGISQGWKSRSALGCQLANPK
jgi:CheY-like chemotaxis protein